MSDAAPHTRCRVCDAPLGAPYLDLGEQPLANGFLHHEDLAAPEFTAPLQIALCESCGLSQLLHVVAPERLYSNYLFTSGTSASWRAHCAKLAEDHTREHGAGFVLEIAANDGTMLAAFKQRGHRVLGVEPAQNILQPIPVPMLATYWSSEVAEQIRLANGPADLIIATNVLGHVDDVRDFLRGIALALDRWGIAIIECPHIMPLLYLNAFDTIYHEHLSYWSLRPLMRAAKDAGLSVFHVAPQAVHGGTMRYFLCHGDHARESVFALWKRECELELTTPAPYQEFAATVRSLKPKLQGAFQYKTLWGAGASAKGNTLLNYVGATLAGIFDDAPQKQHLFTPGRHIPVWEWPQDMSIIPALALLSWNWARELKAKARALGFGGEFLTPIPVPKWERA